MIREDINTVLMYTERDVTSDEASRNKRYIHVLEIDTSHISFSDFKWESIERELIRECHKISHKLRDEQCSEKTVSNKCIDMYVRDQDGFMIALFYGAVMGTPFDHLPSEAAKLNDSGDGRTTKRPRLLSDRSQGIPADELRLAGLYTRDEGIAEKAARLFEERGYNVVRKP